MTNVVGSLRVRIAALIGVVVVAAAVVGATSRSAHAIPPSNAVVLQWNQIAENTVVGSGAFQAEGFLYMGYASLAVYDAVVAIQGGYAPYASAIGAPAGASVDAAVVEAAYRTLRNYFPSSCNPACNALGASLDTSYANAMSAIPNGLSKTAGIAVGLAAANQIVSMRTGDGRQTPIASTSGFEKMDPGPGVWRLTPGSASAQTPWLGDVQPFLLKKPGQFQPHQPVPLQSKEWVRAFDEIKAVGGSTSAVRTPEQTATAWFWTANVIRQYNVAARDLAGSPNSLSLLDTARLLGMVNAVGADALMSVLNSKYKFLFWRPVTAIDPTSVTSDGYGPVPGFDDGNPATVEQPGWRPLVTTPNHPEYPAAHGTITGAEAEVFSEFLGTDQINLSIHGNSNPGAPPNLLAVRHFDTADQLRTEIVNARLWAGLHYRPSSEAGLQLGEKVAHYDLNHAFQPTR